MICSIRVIRLILLIGLMAKNGILLVEFAEQERQMGALPRAAILSATKTRFRPIMMTILSTALGALPLIQASGAGSEARSAIGWTIFAGLILSAVFTLFLTPVIYLLISQKQLGQLEQDGDFPEQIKTPVNDQAEVEG